ncbi:MAG TPA: LPS assembly lipoprotein LptE [Caulobacterales bacterium]|nr:LPS assembly lipoprotein LptE [Caulobacterales bacterium]
MRVLIASMALLLAGCGFEPMYAPSAHGRMAIGPVHVETIEGKAGFVLKSELDRMLSVEDNGATPSQLDISLKESVVLLGLRLDESASRAELRLTADYVLTPAEAGARPLRGSIDSVVTYEIPTAAFGEISAQDDARERAAETLAQRMRAELAIRLHQRSSGS